MNTKISYDTLAEKVGDMVMANRLPYADLSIVTVNGDNEQEFYQSYIITDQGAALLVSQTNECVSFIEELDLYVWNINHFGTSWSGVYTDFDEDADFMSTSELYELTASK